MIDYNNNMDIPQEIINSIIIHLRHDYSTLLSLCLVCRGFLPESRRCLYSKVALAKSGQGSSLPYGCLALELDRNVQFLTTISQLNPSLANYIHTFVYIFEQNKEDDDEIMVLLNTSLQLMSKLKNLSLYFSRSPLSRLIQRCTFELEVFRYIPWVTEWNGNSVDLYEFLINQPSLTRLLLWEVNLHNTDPKILWPAGAFFHQLKHLTATTADVERVLQICSATSLSLPIIMGGDFPEASNLEEKFGNVEALCLHSSLQGESVIAPLLGRFRNLQVLHISGSLSKDFLFARFSEMLYKLPKLRIYIQSSPGEQKWNNPRGGLTPFLDSHQGAASWFKVLHYLQAVYVQQLPISEARCFLVWERGSAKSIEVDASEVWEISPWV